MANSRSRVIFYIQNQDSNFHNYTDFETVNTLTISLGTHSDKPKTIICMANINASNTYPEITSHAYYGVDLGRSILTIRTPSFVSGSADPGYVAYLQPTVGFHLVATVSAVTSNSITLSFARTGTYISAPYWMYFFVEY